MQQVIIKKLKPKPKTKQKPNCYNCLNSSRRISGYELPPSQLFCSKWQTIVSCGYAKLCDYFTPLRSSNHGNKKIKRR